MRWLIALVFVRSHAVAAAATSVVIADGKGSFVFTDAPRNTPRRSCGP